MKLNLLAVGQKMPQWVTEGYNEYAKRMPRECQLLLNEIAPAKRGKSGSTSQWMQEEGKRIMTALPENDYVVALEVGGRNWSTEQLAEQLKNWQASGRDVSLLVGGPDGLSRECQQRADQQWSLSNLTLPHPLVRIVVAEQLYRAWTVLQNHPYHRA
ncbi:MULTISPECIES: 23S rRNA (pseudouridine(1915)-N(3))-methyltransferase RlmH [Methylophaga]|uniref:Ribosomal RNA large subunit methyltransferase H n=1 Tax=Methylophaga muralis TaxID=291169 RepID=A0A1E3GPR4_9GAMM|nr:MULTISPECIES: 23S rRNA (pseudouridine(1915)-N(3))-methyltransferase RlmH [Methylophaga]ODN66024.1 Ribosomal RNA large subunit methyltransferase H [Methylophaga muralis]THK43165.1 23S rRNA (pseudouridine(1915)-N(3))-methyltransferase RlmH [Methylophaga sp. SB9B]